jgi:diketogulonate reductase-like aldo/keto reductase
MERAAMATATLVEANGAKIPAIGLGTFKLTGDAATQAVTAALGAGYRHIDTADMYGNEEAVGLGLRDGGVKRDDIFVTTKVWHDNLEGGKLLRSAEGSLKKLGLEQVDLLLIHWPSPQGRVEDWIRDLCLAKTRGLARHIGVSNFTVDLLDRAVACATEPLVANQCEYHPYLDQKAVLAACRRHGIAFTSYCPLGRGSVSDEPLLQQIARAKGKTASQIVLRWHVQQPGIVAIPKSGTPKHIAENIDVFDFTLSDAEMAQISELKRSGGRVVDPAFAPHWDLAA